MVDSEEDGKDEDGVDESEGELNGNGEDCGVLLQGDSLDDKNAAVGLIIALQF